MSQKVCPTCHQTKDVNKNNFIRSKLHDVDGFSFDCRFCHVQKFLEAERALVLSHPNFDVSSKRNEKKVSTKKSAEKKAEIDRLLDEGLKQCSHCHQVKDVSEFGLNEKTYSGLTSQCKQCNAKLCKERRNMKKVSNEAK
jgi:hypothetical protein